MDKIGAAIAAQQARPAAVQTEIFTMELTSGRTVDIRIPLDCTVIDILEFVARAAGQLPMAIAERKQQGAGRLVLPT